jgi:hypothetical protein
MSIESSSSICSSNELGTTHRVVDLEIHYKQILGSLEIASLTLNALFCLSSSMSNQYVHALLALAATYLVLPLGEKNIQDTPKDGQKD